MHTANILCIFFITFQKHLAEFNQAIIVRSYFTNCKQNLSLLEDVTISYCHQYCKNSWGNANNEYISMMNCILLIVNKSKRWKNCESWESSEDFHRNIWVAEYLVSSPFETETSANIFSVGLLLRHRRVSELQSLHACSQCSRCDCAMQSRKILAPSSIETKWQTF